MENINTVEVSPVDLDALRERVSVALAGEMQKRHFALAAIDAAKEALVALRTQGWDFELVPRQAKQLDSGDEFPKMFYHASLGALVVDNAESAKALSPGWQDKPIGWKEPSVKQVHPVEVSPTPATVDIAEYAAKAQAAGVQLIGEV